MATALNTNMTKVYSAQYKLPGKIYSGVIYYYNSGTSSRNVTWNLKEGSVQRVSKIVTVVKSAVCAASVTWVGSSDLDNGNGTTQVSDDQTKQITSSTIDLNYNKVVSLKVITATGAASRVEQFNGAGTAPVITLKSNLVVEDTKTRNGTGS